MRIGLVIHDCDPRYGQGLYAVELMRRLSARHQFEVFANTFVFEESSSVRFHRVPAFRRTALSTIASFSLKADRLLRESGVDLVHAQGLTCWKADVVTAHACNGGRLAREWRNWSWMQRLRVLPVVWMEKRFYRNCDGQYLIGVSEKVNLEIARQYGWKTESGVIYHGTDTEQFRPAASPEERRAARREFGIPEKVLNEWWWLFMGEANKGLQEVLECLAQFPAARLLVVTRSGMQPYEGLADSLGVRERVRFFGPTAHPERAFLAVDVFVFPSRYDTFAMVVSEAMACGVPVVVGKEIGAAEWIRSGDNGWLCDPDAPESLTSALKWLEADQERAWRLGEQGRKTVLKHSWDQCALETEQVYERVLERKSLSKSGS